MPKVRRCRQPGCHAIVPYPNHYCSTHSEHETEYQASRQRWTRSHDQQHVHHYNTVTRNRSETKAKQYNYYRSRQWQGIRLQALERDHYLCQYCKVQGIVTTAKTGDHIVPIEYDNTLQSSLDNIATICSHCHRLKTGWEQSYYGTGQGNELQNVTEIHDIDSVVLLMQKHDALKRV